MAAAITSQSDIIVFGNEKITSLSAMDNKTDLVREKILSVICSQMPISVLFNQNLKLNLYIFEKDQAIIYKIAEFLSTIIERPFDPDIIAKLFEKNPLFLEVTECLKQSSDLNSCLKLFWEAFYDVLNEETQFPDQLEEAIKGRIYTLRNALVAQLFPKKIMENQSQYGLQVQSESDIKEMGKNFLRICLKHYLNLIQKRCQEKPFREILHRNAQDLAPFVRFITKSYMTAICKDLPTDVLKYRSLKGYNWHGIIASSILDSCLQILGYTTRLCYRSDLNPRVTIVTDHSIVEVTDSKGEKWVVDPTYNQFFNDIPMTELSNIPSDSILVMHKSEIDSQINNMMRSWQYTYQLVKPFIKNGQFNILINDDTMKIVKLISDQSQIASFFLEENDCNVPGGPEKWTRTSLKRVWDCESYPTQHINSISQEIFKGMDCAYKEIVGKIGEIHSEIQQMCIGSLIPTLSFQEVKDCLDKIVRANPKMNYMNFLDLLIQFPFRANYEQYFKYDSRLNINRTFNAYYCSVKEIVNQSNYSKKVIYACSGADIMTVLLSTNAEKFIFVDTTLVSLKEFNKALSKVQQFDSSFMIQYAEYIDKRKNSLSGDSQSFSTDNLPIKLMLDLKLLGVNLKNVRLSEIKNGINIDFEWSHYTLQDSLVKRTLTYIPADITNPSSYPELLKTEIEKGYNFLYMKAAIDAPKEYSKFMPYLGKYLNNQGWLMTSDRTVNMEVESLLECLAGDDNLIFETRTNQEIEDLKKIITSNTFAFYENPTLSLPRRNRKVRSNELYWIILNLYQKI